MRRVLAIVSLVSALALVPAGSATAGPGEFTFYGSGFGHGLGMSQWGSYGLALDGWSHQRILTHFYSGTRLGQAEDVPATLRVGLTQGRDKVRLQAQEGPVDLRLGGRAQGDTVATIPRGQTWVVRVVDGRYRIVDADGQAVGEDLGGTSEDLFVVYEPRGSRVRIPEAYHSYARGWIELAISGCTSRCSMRLVLTIDPEEYLYGLGEVPSSWPMQALEAQAIAARTYALRKAASGQHRPGCDCALYASSYDQVYAGWDKEGATDGDRWVRAVDATDGTIVTYRGDAIQAFYMSSSGGFTEDNENVWGGTPIEYLRGVCDPGDYTASNPSATWEVTFTAPKLTKRLGLGIGTVEGFGSVVRGVSGRIVEATVNGERGSVTITGATLRSALGLRDDRVWINRDRQVTGAIRDKYDAMDCSPGLALSRQVAVAGGLRQVFEDATIYRSDAAGTHALHGPVLAFYGAHGGPSGNLGFPTSDVRELPNGNLRASFEHGVVTCRPNGTCSRS